MIRNLWRNLFHRRAVEADIDAEVRATLDLLEDEARRGGSNEREARRSAILALGRPESLKERIRDVRAGAWIETWFQDVRYAVRLLRRSPLFAAFAIASLALGLGATGAIFSLFDGIVLRTLAVPEPDRLVLASFGKPGTRFNYSMPYPQFDALRQRSTTLESICVITPAGRVTVTAQGEAQAADGLYVSGDYYRTLRLAPAAGRLLDATDDRSGQAVAVITYAYWQRRFGGRNDIVGTAVRLNQVPFTIVGVEPHGFTGTEVGRPYDITIPLRALELLSEEKPSWRGPFTTWLYMMGRLRPGVTLAGAESESRSLFTQAGLDAARNAGEQQMARESVLRFESGARGTSSDLRNGYERWLRLLLTLLGAVLLLASLNVATLMLSRSDARQREIATRLALGAGRRRVIRQFLTESLVLSAAAGAAGFALALWGSDVLLRIATPAAERPPIELPPNLRLLTFMLAASAGTCLLFGLIPAIRATSPRRLHAARQIGGGRQRRLLDRALVGSQVALSLMLLVAAGLFLRTLGNLWAQNPGYDRSNVIMFSVDPRLAGKRGTDVPDTYRGVLDGLKSIPGARAVTMSAVRPVSDNYYFVTSFSELGGRAVSFESRVRAAFNHVAPGYFTMLGIPFVAGRDFDERDIVGAPGVAIISERMARHFQGNPIGQPLERGPAARVVVGVVKDMRYANVRDAEREVVYFPIFQIKPQNIFYSPTFEVRAAGSALDLVPAIRAAVSRVDPGLMLFRIRTLEAQTQDSFARERLLAVLSAYFGGFAALLACVGLYGLMSYGVTQRTAEMGLRMALGAPPAAVRWLVVRESAWTVIAGATGGLAAALAAVRLVQSQLFGVEPHDPAALGGGTVLLLVMALVAAYLPARRASRIDPLHALRHE
jgi:predicted permease